MNYGKSILQRINAISKQVANLDIAPIVAEYLRVNPPTGYTHPSTHPASMITEDLNKLFVSDTEKQTWDAKVDKVTGSRLITSGELLQILDGSTHAGLPHAPSNAQKNSDITKAEVEAILTGPISTHSHTGGVSPAFNSVYRAILDSTGSHIAGKAANTYGIPQGNPLAVTGTGTLYALNTIYIAGADYPTIDGKVTKLRVRCVIACNDVAPFTGTFKIGLHPVTRPATSGGAGLCIYTIGSPIAASQVTGTNLAADSLNNLVGADFDLPADGFYVLAVVTSATMATSSHCHISASLQIRNI
jgi:hypothetical protein